VNNRVPFVALLVLVVSSGTLTLLAAGGRQAADAGRALPHAPATIPLRELSHTEISGQGGLVAWADPTRCDSDGNVYFLLAPHTTPREVESAARAGRSLPLSPRQVVRISVDGRKSTTFDPGLGSKLADASTLTTLGMAVDPQGTLYLLVWATWGSVGGETEKSGQYIVSISDEGKVRSQVEVDWHEMLVHQLEVFGSGAFLLRGRRTGSDEARVAIQSASGGALQDVMGWSGYPTTLVEEPSGTGAVTYDYMVRGGDGRIYFAEQNGQHDRISVYSFGASGDNGRAFDLQPLGRDERLLGLLSAGDRFAAAYLEARPGHEGSPSELRGSWWIGVYDNAADAGLQAVYGPAPAEPVCYQRSGSEDRFTFLIDGSQLVTMAP
jgi:hypothetical protein